jgi:hypothetical protein
MKVLTACKWGSLYVLNIVLAGLLLVDMRTAFAASLQKLIAAAIMLLFAILNLAWVETHASLMEREGVDAATEKDLCRSAPYLLYVAGMDEALVCGDNPTESRADSRPPALVRLPG